MVLNRILTLVLFVFTMGSVVAQSFDLKDIDEKLQKIHDEDQQIREKWEDAVQNKLPAQSIESEMHSIDSLNQIYVSKLLDEYGWPDNLSENANEAIFLVIDHAKQSFSEKYFPFVKEKSEKGILQKLSVATLEDRILMRSGKPQKYGTQTVGVLYTYSGNISSDTKKMENIIYIWPIEDNEKVDELRAAVGLPPMDQYIQELGDGKTFKVIWDKEMSIEELKEKLPALFGRSESKKDNN